MSRLFRSKRLEQLAKNSMTLFLGSKFQAVLLFAQSIVVARSLGVVRFGKWAIVVSICGLAMNFLTFRTIDVLGKFFVELRVKKDFSNLGLIIRKTIFIELLMRALAMVTIMVLSVMAVGLFKGPENKTVYFLYGMSFFFHFAGAVWFCLERDNSNYKTIAVLSFLRALLRLSLILFFFLVMNQVNLMSLALSFFLSGLVVMIIKIFRSNKLLLQYGQLSIKTVFSKRIASPGSIPVLKEYWQFVRASYFSTSVMSVLKKIDILAAGFFFSSESVGLLKLGKNIARFIQDLAINMSRPIYQEFNELISAGKHRRILDFLKKNLKYYLGLIFIALLVVSFFIEPFINLVYGSEFLGSVPFLKVYLILVFFELGGFWLTPLALALRGWNFQLKILLASLPFLLVSVVGFRYLWGLIGIIIACIFIRFLLKIGMLVFVWRNLKVAKDDHSQD